MGSRSTPARRETVTDRAGSARWAASPDGFSLIEALIATGVLATAVAGLLQLFIVAAQANVASRDATYATVLALQKIEELRAGPLPPHTDTTEFLDAQGRALPGEARGARYERRWTVAALPADTVMVTVIVSRRGAPARAVHLTTIRTRRDE